MLIEDTNLIDKRDMRMPDTPANSEPDSELPDSYCTACIPPVYEAQTFDDVLTFDILYNSGLVKSIKGVLWKDSTIGYYVNGAKNTIELLHDLKTGNYIFQKYSIFDIHEPKTRQIAATRIRDRQIQRVVSDHILYPQFTRSFIYANCACQKDKGNHMAMDLMRDLLIHHVNRNRSQKLPRNDGYALKCDVKSFFPSTSHKMAHKTIKRYIKDPAVSQFTCDIVTSFNMVSWFNQYHKEDIEKYGETKANSKAARNATLTRAYHRTVEMIKNHEEDTGLGMGLGSQVSQLIQLAILDGMDHYIKEVLHIKCYIRYMDDFILVHNDKEYLKECEQKIRDYISVLGFKLNHKTQIYMLKDGFEFLKLRYLITETGKVVRKSKHDKIVKLKKRLCAFKDKIEDPNDKFTIQNARDSFISWQGGLWSIGQYNLINSGRRIFFEIIGEQAQKYDKHKYKRKRKKDSSRNKTKAQNGSPSSTSKGTPTDQRKTPSRS